MYRHNLNQSDIAIRYIYYYYYIRYKLFKLYYYQVTLISYIPLIININQNNLKGIDIILIYKVNSSIWLNITIQLSKIN